MKKLYIKLLLIAMILVLNGCQNSEMEITEQLNLGEKYLAELDYENAILAFEKAIEIEPKELNSYIKLAQVYTAIQDHQSAIEVLEQGLVVCNLLLEEERTQISEDLFKQMKESLTDQYLQLAEVYEQQGDFERALEILRQGGGELVNQAYQDKIVQLEEQLKLEQAIGIRMEQLILTYEQDTEVTLEFLQDEKFQQIASELAEPYLLQQTDGNYIGIYPDGYIYIGQMVNGLREGYGKWYYQSSLVSRRNGYLTDTFISYVGEWKGDLPNGSGCRNAESINEVGETSFMSLEGNFENKMLDGMFIRKDRREDGTWHEFEFQFRNGVPESGEKNCKIDGTCTASMKGKFFISIGDTPGMKR